MTSREHRIETEVNRRQLLIRAAKTGAVAAGALLWGGLFYSREPVRRRDEKIYTFRDYRAPEPAKSTSFAVVHGTDREKMVRAAVDHLGGISRFIRPGERVLIKPNVGWDRQPEEAANTHPELVGAVVRLCLTAGASQVWVTDVSVNDPYRSFARSGIEETVQKAGGKIRYTTDNDFVQTDLQGEVLKVWPVSRFYHEVDRVINMPIVKHHSLSKCTIALKNWYGVLGGRRNRLHQKINESIADLAAAIRPTLTLVDATRVLIRNGPTGGSLADVSVENTILAGEDAVALDAWSLRYLDLSVADVPYLGLAEQQGVGVSDWASLNPAEFSAG
jgi:uncharacterized protein (DUF362 family)